MGIHPTAVISPKAELDSSVEVGPFAIIEGRVQIGKGSSVGGHSYIGSPVGRVVFGENNRIFPGAMIGGAPQDLKYSDEPTELLVGNGNTFREFTTVNRGTESGGGVTKIGNENLFMAYVHIAHDCEFGNHIAVANTTNFAGHVRVHDHVKVSGCCNFSQFVVLGEHCYIAGDSTANKDVLPYSIAHGSFAVVRATNKVGLERSGFSKEEIDEIHRAVRYLSKGDRTVEEALQKIKENCKMTPHIEKMIQFVNESERGLAR